MASSSQAGIASSRASNVAPEKPRRSKYKVASPLKARSPASPTRASCRELVPQQQVAPPPKRRPARADPTQERLTKALRELQIDKERAQHRRLLAERDETRAKRAADALVLQQELERTLDMLAARGGRHVAAQLGPLDC